MNKLLVGLCACFLATTLSFAFLWQHETKNVRTKEIIREVAVPKEVLVEKIREVPKEVIKEVEVTREVPAKIPEHYEKAAAFWNAYIEAPYAKKQSEVLKGIPDLRVCVSLNDSVKKTVSEAEVKTKFELKLRQFGILLKDDSTNYLYITSEGLWDEREYVLTYRTSARLSELLRAPRPSGYIVTLADTWTSGSYGYAGKSISQKSVLEATEQIAEIFANDYLEANPKK